MTEMSDRSKIIEEITRRIDEEIRLCKVTSHSFGPMVGADFARKLGNELAQAHEKEREEISTLKEMVYERSKEIEQLHGMVDAWRTRAEVHRRSAETSGATLDALSATLAERDRALELLNEQNNDWGRQAVKQQQRHNAQLSALQSELATAQNLLKERAELISEWQDSAHKAFAKVGEQENELANLRSRLQAAKEEITRLKGEQK